MDAHEQGHVERIAPGTHTLVGAQRVLTVCRATGRYRTLVVIHALVVERVLLEAVGATATETSVLQHCVCKHFSKFLLNTLINNKY